MTNPGAAPIAKPVTKSRRWMIAAGGLALRALAATWRIREINGRGYREIRASGRPIVFAFWHGRMLPLLWKHRHEGAVVLISEHGDGELIARVAMSLGYRTVRGSTFRGAQRALMGIIRELEQGHDAAFTPDGPRGPLEEFAPGAAVAAQRTGAPMILVGAGAAWSWRLKSWDRFLIPKPFARVTIEYSEPQVLSHASARDAAADAPRLQEELKAITARTDA